MEPHVSQRLSQLEEALQRLTQSTSTFIDSTTNFMHETRANFKNQEASIRNMEVQIGQIAKQLSERPLNTFPSNIIPNSREECKAIRVIELEEISEVQVEAQIVKLEDVAKIKNQEAIHHPPQSSKKHTKPFSKLLEVFSCLKVNIPLLKHLEETPIYVKNMKELLLNKRTLKKGRYRSAHQGV
ncbi:hypothetical protein PIB30_027700 [Stylosanthes scabra]|uniref:Uncharacterized protein n=1 Tax=Stylosanthes scabra TaxID=79078 RepID=A0ABU6V8U1_9FABA|nr:hypothetical protein [Stylosanthes scabra]